MRKENIGNIYVVDSTIIMEPLNRLRVEVAAP